MKIILATCALALTLVGCGGQATPTEHPAETVDKDFGEWKQVFDDDEVMKRCDGSTLVYAVMQGGSVAVIPNSPECSGGFQ